MGITNPDWARELFTMAGVPEITADEDVMRKERDDRATALSAAGISGAKADTAVGGTAHSYRGDSATELAGYWEQAGNSGGHLAQASSAVQPAPTALHGLANVVSGSKVAQISLAAAGLVSIRAALIGGPAGSALAVARLMAVRRAGMRILHEAAQGTGHVLGPAVTRRITTPLQRIVPRGPGTGGGPPLAPAGGPRLTTPRGPGGLRNPEGPSGSNIAQMGRKNRRRDDNNRRGGGGGGLFGRRNRDGDRSGHAESRQAQRGISDDMVEQAKDSGTKRPGNQKGTTKHEGENVWVVTDKNGFVISTGWKNNRKK